MPQTPYIIYGIVTTSNGVGASNAHVEFTVNSLTQIVITNYKGIYQFDLAELGYSSGDTVIYSAKDEFNNEVYIGSFVIAGDSKVLNISLSSRTDAIYPSGNRSFQLYTIGSKPIHSDNPFPVITPFELNGHPECKGNVQVEWEVTNDDGQPESETITAPDNVQYKRYFTYSTISGMRLLTKRTKWEKV